jgi:hypothetical protein
MPPEVRGAGKPAESADGAAAAQHLFLGERSPGKSRQSANPQPPPSGGNDEVVDHVSGARHALNRDAAAMSTRPINYPR